MAKKYGIGLDIGTNSIGYSIVDEKGKLIRVKSKMGIGVRIFKAGEAAADRRGFRTTRRRLKRRKWRLGLLREIFDAPIAEIDPDFFARQRYFNQSTKDPAAKGYDKQLFSDRSDKDFYKQYPTIYHLRHALKTEHRQFDIREIYLAIHHIVKYRGHFLQNGTPESFRSQSNDVCQTIAALAEQFQRLLDDPSFVFEPAVGDHLLPILTDVSLAPSDRAKQVASLMKVDNTDKDVAKRNQTIVAEISKALTGLQTRLDKLFQVEISKDDETAWKTRFDVLDDYLTDNGDQFESEEQHEILSLLQQLYAKGIVDQLVPSGEGISEGMIARYEQHGKDLHLLKKYAWQQSEKTRREILDNYDHYINGVDSKSVDWDTFTKNISKLIDATDPVGAQITTLISTGQFLLKPRSKANANIPHQLHQLELDDIINNQKAYYPWLAEPNPVTRHRKQGQPFKLDELVSFRIPYYVGPMITKDVQAKTSGKSFAWMVAKGDAKGAITPWNFADKVDLEASATEFIERMKTTDTYLVGEDVLPAASLLYQRFTVLNELNNVKANDQRLTPDQKQRVYETLFVKGSKRRVTITALQDELVAASEYLTKPEITGLADPAHFNSGLTAYHDLQSIIPEAIDDPAKQSDIEQIILWSTLFEDHGIFLKKLAEISWLTDDQRKRLSTKRYRGWGQLSAKLLTGIKDHGGKTVMDQLWTTQQNLMQVLKSTDYAEAIQKANSGDLTPADIIDAAYTSPSNRKALRQVLAVVQDIEKAVGYAPSWVYVEAADGEQRNPQRTIRRGERLQAVYEEYAKPQFSSQVQR